MENKPIIPDVVFCDDEDEPVIYDPDELTYKKAQDIAFQERLEREGIPEIKTRTEYDRIKLKELSDDLKEAARYKYTPGTGKNGSQLVVDDKTKKPVLRKDTTHNGNLIKTLIKNRYGSDYRRLFSVMCKIAEYRHNPQRDGNKPLFSERVVFEAQKLLFQYAFGKPAETIEVEKNINVNVEHKLSSVAKLLNDNKERLKLVGGGKK